MLIDCYTHLLYELFNVYNRKIIIKIYIVNLVQQFVEKLRMKEYVKRFKNFAIV